MRNTHTTPAPPRNKTESGADNPGGSSDLKTLPQNTHKNLPAVKDWEKELVSALVYWAGMWRVLSLSL